MYIIGVYHPPLVLTSNPHYKNLRDVTWHQKGANLFYIYIILFSLYTNLLLLLSFCHKRYNNNKKYKKIKGFSDDARVVTIAVAVTDFASETQKSIEIARKGIDKYTHWVYSIATVIHQTERRTNHDHLIRKPHRNRFRANRLQEA